MQKYRKKYGRVDTCIPDCVQCTGWLLKGERRGPGLRESLFLAPYLPRKANSRNITYHLPSSLAEIGDNDDAL